MKIVYGTILNPLSPLDLWYCEDGALVFDEKTGKILFVGEAKEAREDFPQAEKVDTPDNILITPSFVDAHLHAVQYKIIGTFEGVELLPWLQKFTWPEESKFAKSDYAEKVFQEFLHDLLRNGTTTAAVYSSIHENAVHALYDISQDKARLFIGNVLMDQNSPDYLLQKTDDAINVVERLAKKYKDRYVVTPRFAITCSMKLMKSVAAIARKYNCFIQTHLSENKEEVEFVRKLFPDCKNYTDVYYQAGLLGPKSIMGHAIYLSNQELELLRNTNTKIAHCPISNYELLSGRMTVERFLLMGVNFTLGTDIAGGHEISMLGVMRRFLDEHRYFAPIRPSQALYWGTLDGAEALGLQNVAGNLAYGKYADFLVLHKPKGAVNPDEYMEGLMAGDYDNIVAKTFFEGREVYSKQN
ncbi:MAG: guanine deaminase [Candidatus Nealsonbacteria bacterium]|nr:guanine deaminase [Candidatus Nealsonbacteria bacterium]